MNYGPEKVKEESRYKISEKGWYGSAKFGEHIS